jgi:hypothetical protein
MTKESLMILALTCSLYGPQVKQLSQLTHLRHLATPTKVVNYVTAVHALVATVYGRRRLRKSEEQFWYHAEQL